MYRGGEPEEYGSGGYDEASLNDALGQLGFGNPAPGLDAGGYALPPYGAPYSGRSGGYAAPPMSPRAAGQEMYNAQSAVHAELFSDPHAARWLAGAYGGSFDPERLMAAEQLEQARPPMSPSYHSLYKTELCRSFVEEGTCRYGSKCQFAHGEDELRPVLRHPRYKTELCRTFATSGTCPYGTRCRFIHYRGAAATGTAPGGAKLTVTVPPGSPGSPRFVPPPPMLRSAATPPPSPAKMELAAHAAPFTPQAARSALFTTPPASPAPAASPASPSPPRAPHGESDSSPLSYSSLESSPDTPVVDVTPAKHYDDAATESDDSGGASHAKMKRLPIFEKLCHAKEAAAAAAAAAANAGSPPPKPPPPSRLIIHARSAVCE